MGNKIYRYKQLAANIQHIRRGKLYGRAKHIKSWHRPIAMIRKRGNLTCEGCYFSTPKLNTPEPCKLMLKTYQLPTCAPHYIFVKLGDDEKLKEAKNTDNTQKLKIA